MDKPTITPLRFEDEALRDIPCPRRVLRLVRGLGSGLSRGADGRLWAVGDRGPNLKVSLAVEEYGLEGLGHADTKAKIMPTPEFGPTFAEVAIEGDTVRVMRLIPLKDEDGKTLSGLPTPGSKNSRREPALGMAGEALGADPGGVDSEGIAAAPDGSFWIGDEYGPSLLRVDREGKVLMRWVPEGEERTIEGAPYPAAAVLPAIAARRHVNRGFEGLALIDAGATLVIAFQSPLAHPDESIFAAARHIRLMALDAESGALKGQWAYRLEKPRMFLRDGREGKVERSDLKVSELTSLGGKRLAVLERCSASTKIYVVDLDPELALGEEHGLVETRPTLEELSVADEGQIPELPKRLLFDSDHHPEVSKDLEGMTLLDERTLLLVNDNDFGIEDAKTMFWQVAFEAAI